MTQQITKFNFNNNELSTVTDESGNPWFIAKDVAGILGYGDTEAMTRRLDTDEVQNLQIVGFGNRGVNIINESGLYSAVLGSKKPEAKAFKKWVTSEVLPSIRKNGAYVQGQASTDMVDVLKAIAALQEQQKITAEEHRVAIERIENSRSDDAVSLSKSKDYATVRKMRKYYPLRKFSGKELTKVSDDLNIPVRYVHDEHDQGVQTYHRDAWFKKYGVNI